MEHLIPTLLALRISEEPELEEGETRPLKFECAPIDDLMKPSTYVVKFSSLVTRQNVGIAAEIIASILAQYFQIPTPDVALVEITDSLAESASRNFHTPAHILTAINQNRHSNNFGSILVSHNLELPMPMHTLTEQQIFMAGNIFAFDALIYNADRTEVTPNIFAQENSFIVFDHEKAFNFLSQNPIILPNDMEFRTTQGRAFLHSHIFWSQLRRRDVDFDFFIRQLEVLNDNIIEDIINQVPYDIRSHHESEIAAIEDHLYFVRDNSRDFRYGLMRALL